MIRPMATMSMSTVSMMKGMAASPERSVLSMLRILITCGLECRFGQALHVFPNIGRPGRNQGFKARAISREQGARSLFKTIQIAGHGRHELEGRVLRLAPTISPGTGAPGLLDQLAQGHGCATRLAAQPLPM